MMDQDNCKEQNITRHHILDQLTMHMIRHRNWYALLDMSNQLTTNQHSTDLTLKLAHSYVICTTKQNQATFADSILKHTDKVLLIVAIRNCIFDLLYLILSSTIICEQSQDTLSRFNVIFHKIASTSPHGGNTFII